MSKFREDRAIRIYEGGPEHKRVTYLGANIAYFTLSRDSRIADFLARYGKQFSELPFSERPEGSVSMGHIAMEPSLNGVEVAKLGDLCLDVLADGQFDNGAGYAVIDNRKVPPLKPEGADAFVQDGPVIAPDPLRQNVGFGDLWPAGRVSRAAEAVSGLPGVA